jgi:hypothetical protein
MTEKELYEVYARWSGELHFWVTKHLGRHIDCEFFPAPDWTFKLYGGEAQRGPTEFIEGEQGFIGISTVPKLIRPPDERTETIFLPRPEDDPTQRDLDDVFRLLCLAAARLLRVKLAKPVLTSGDSTQRLPASAQAAPASRPKRVRARHPAKLRQPPPAKD